MQKVRFGRTELEVSRIALGGIPIMRLGLDEAVRVVREAIALGINFIDTANAYEDSEIKIGTAIRGTPRSELVIATKTAARDKQTLKRHLDLSLKQLGLEYIDLYQLHNITAGSRKEIFDAGGAFEGLLEAIRAGKVRFPAFSCHSVPLAIEIMKEGCFDAVQLPFNFIDTEAAAEAIPLARELDMGFIAMKPMGGGLLYNAGLSFRYLMQFDNIIPDPGIEKMAELKEIIEIIEAREPFSDEDAAAIEKLRRDLGASWCHRCGYCQPCPQGIPISSILSAKSFLKRYTIEGAKAMMGNAVEKAANCLDCRSCVARCPYNLEIPALLRENIGYWAFHTTSHTE